MFDIFTNYTIEDCNELTLQVNDLRYLISDVETAKGNISTLSQMDQVMTNLNSVIEQMEEENRVLSQMTKALDKINYHYVSTENKICDVTDQSVIRYTRRELTSVDLKDISSMLRDITLE